MKRWQVRVVGFALALFVPIAASLPAEAAAQRLTYRPHSGNAAPARSGNVASPAAIPTGTWIYILSKASERCLDADTHTLGDNGTKVQLWTCNNQLQQQWMFEYRWADNLRLKNRASGRCLDVDTHTVH